NVKLFGDRYQSRYYKYLKSKTHETKFEPNHVSHSLVCIFELNVKFVLSYQIDLFVIETEDDLGMLYAIELKLGSVLDAMTDQIDLGLDKIEIEVDQLKFFFHFKSSIMVKHAESYVKLLLLEQNAQFL